MTRYLDLNADECREKAVRQLGYAHDRLGEGDDVGAQLATTEAQFWATMALTAPSGVVTVTMTSSVATDSAAAAWPRGRPSPRWKSSGGSGQWNG